MPSRRSGKGGGRYTGISASAEPTAPKPPGGESFPVAGGCGGDTHCRLKCPKISFFRTRSRKGGTFIAHLVRQGDLQSLPGFGQTSPESETPAHAQANPSDQGGMRRSATGMMILVPVLLMLTGTAVGFLAVEAAYRYYLYIQLQAMPSYWAANDSIYEYHPDFGYTHPPGKSIVEVKVEKGYPVLWNERFTDGTGNMTAAKRTGAPGGQRLLVLGDSFTAFQRDGVTWPDLLQEKLDARFPGMFGVVNCGRNMYGILQMFDLGVEKAKELQPDLVIVAFITDDLTRPRFWMTVESIRGEARVIRRGTPADGNGSDSGIDAFLVHPGITKDWCMSMMGSVRSEDPVLKAMNERYRDLLDRNCREAFFTGKASFVFNRLVRGDAFHGLVRRGGEPALTAKAYREDSRFLRQVAFLHASRVPTLLVHLPTYRELREGKYLPDGRQKELLQCLRELTGRKIVNLIDHMVLPNGEIERLFLLPHDGHPSRAGLEILSDAMFNLLTRDVLTLPDVRKRPGSKTRNVTERRAMPVSEGQRGV